MSDYPKALQELVDEIKASSDPAYVSDLLVEYGESFKEVPEQIATRPFNKDHLVPGCESEAYIWATSVEGMPQFYFAVENPQGISAKAMAAIIDETFSDLSTEEISKISEEVVYDIFGKELSMGKALGLMNMIRMIKSLAKDL